MNSAGLKSCLFLQ